MDLLSLFSFRKDEQVVSHSTPTPAPKDLADFMDRLGEIRDRKARDLMKPRALVEAIDVDLEVTRLATSKSGVSYFPVYRGDLDKVVGWISRETLQGLIHDGYSGNLNAEYVPADVIPEDMPLDRVFLRFVKTSAPLLVVKSLSGQTTGILYLSDVLDLFFGLDIETPLSQLANG